MERRRNARLDINLQCRLTSPRAGTPPLVAVTENMSRGDILVQLAADLANGAMPCTGDPLIVEIDLPANHTFGRKCMQCQTTVVRIDPCEAGGARLALRVHKMRFQSCLEFPASNNRIEESLGRLVM